jgi:signal peptidase II
VFFIKKLLITIFPLLIVVIIDQITKQWARGLVDLSTWGPFKFQFVLNDGIMLGHFSELPLKAKQVTLSTLGVFVLIFYFFCIALIPMRSKFITLGLSVLVGGIMGNVIDRFNGFSVVDFITLNISNLPYANLADFFQWAGYLLLGIGIYQDSRYYWPEIDLRNKYFIKPKFQLRFSLLISSMTLASAIIVLLFSFSFFRDDQSQIMIDYFMYLGAGTSLIIAIITFFVCVILSHRIAGPVHAIQRHIRSTMKGEKVIFKLREQDEFKEIQEDMNLLNERK